jgi:hypothetical protein
VNWNAQPALVGSSGKTATVRPLTTTTYTLEGTDSKGCKNTATAVVTVIGCGEVTGLKATVYSPSRVVLQWKSPEGASGDTLQYRKAGTEPWTSVFVTGGQYELNGLQPDTQYEYRVLPLCATTAVFLPSGVETLQVPTLDEAPLVQVRRLPVPSWKSFPLKRLPLRFRCITSTANWCCRSKKKHVLQGGSSLTWMFQGWQAVSIMYMWC